ncbi:hypothetical protein [Microbacterium sp. USTB-Y]|uniref:hypothetical protein n=1 Tax=Microbacterium sp. USTB-Y TaxID=2823692 RepID=UPI00203CC5CE|nr:hypothetical protein [Microbacterium sp. USTB-Y]
MSDESMSNPWAEIVGPCYTVGRAAHVLGWTEEEVVRAGDELRLLTVRTSDDALLVPLFQFKNGAVVAGLPDVLGILATGTAGRWTWAQWLNGRLPSAVTPRNIELLYDGRLDEAVRAAEHDAWAWRS